MNSIITSIQNSERAVFCLRSAGEMISRTPKAMRRLREKGLLDVTVTEDRRVRVTKDALIEFVMRNMRAAE